MSELQKLESFRYSLAVVETVEEVKLIKDATSAYHQLARRQKLGRDKLNDIGKFMVEVEIKLGEYLNKFHKRGQRNDYKQSCNTGNSDKMPVNEHESSRARKIEANKENIDGVYEVIEKTGDIITPNKVHKVLTRKYFPQSTGNNEWYTPSEYIELARQVMGSIDLDPASNDWANKTVKADTYYTQENSGLDKEWKGNIWMNPPFENKLITQFIDKLIESDYNQAIVLTNNYTDTAWFHKLASHSSAICFTKGRIKFYNDTGHSSPTNGQVFFYLGNKPRNHVNIFKNIGICVELSILGKD